MNDPVNLLWLIPTLPLAAAGITAVIPRRWRAFASGLAIGAMAISFVFSVLAFLCTLGTPGAHGVFREVHNFAWFQIGQSTVTLGWILDPLTASMIVMVTFVGTLIFVYSVGYMARDENFTRFFCFLSLFAAAMLGLVIANSLLLLFICWELVGLASYLLIGFWYHKPSAAAAAKKAFITTRIGDIGFFLGLLWLYSETGTLVFYDGGNGCLEQSALTALVTRTTVLGMAAATAISLLIFCGAMGKSGQVPLHVWLPDAMEGPTPVSALIHAATMVAAGVFLVARIYPLMSASTGDASGVATSTALQIVTWAGSITAIFAASIAVAQTDIKRILAYSTVSQLGYMMMGLGVGGVAVGMFHLITHAFFKALLFLGAGSVIHGCHEEQDIRRMGGLKKYMPVTFAAYAIGMMALSGVPIFFSGFWSKDEILHSAWSWPVSRWPFVVGLAGAAATAFYMTRQMYFVFSGSARLRHKANAHHAEAGSGVHAHSPHDEQHEEPELPHESPSIMTGPLIVLAVFTVLLSVIGTPVWPWFHGYLTGHDAHWDVRALFRAPTLGILLLSTSAVGLGMAAAWRLYGRSSVSLEQERDPLEQLQPSFFRVLRQKFYFDELYEMSVVRLNAWCGWISNLLDRRLWEGGVRLVSYCVLGLSWLNRLIDEYVINLGFDRGCRRIRLSGRWSSRLQDGQVQHYLRVIGVAFTILLILLTWGFAS